jgi:hypothetical protein
MTLPDMSHTTSVFKALSAFKTGVPASTYTDNNNKHADK